jgi:hypothetical protein
MPHLKSTRTTIRIAIIQDRTSAVLDRRPQDRTHLFQQVRHLARVQRTGSSQRMDTSPVQRFVAIDVPHPRDRSLIQQQRLDLPTSRHQIAKRPQTNRQRIRSERRRTRIIPPPVSTIHTVQKPHTTESPRIAKTQFHPTPAQSNPQMRVRKYRLANRHHRQPTSHPQPEHQPRRSAKPNHHALSFAIHAVHALAVHPRSQLSQSRLDHVRARHHDPTRDLTAKPVVQRPRDRLRFGQFRHNQIVSNARQSRRPHVTSDASRSLRPPRTLCSRCRLCHAFHRHPPPVPLSIDARAT